jgi:hypothetical protein
VRERIGRAVGWDGEEGFGMAKEGWGIKLKIGFGVVGIYRQQVVAVAHSPTLIGQLRGYGLSASRP